ncbi:MAG: ion channel [Verrucomicrobiota bacterium]|jgi:hypothetical protein
MIFQIICVLLWVLSGIKVLELVASVWWALNKGRDYRIKLLKLVEAGKQDRSLDMEKVHGLDLALKLPHPAFWMLARHLKAKTGLDPCSRVSLIVISFLGKWICRQPMLLVAISALQLFGPRELSIIRVNLFFIVSLVSLELAGLFAARVVMGFADNFRWDFDIDPIRYHLRKKYQWSRADFVTRFVGGIGIFVASSVLGFAAVYYGLCCLHPEGCFCCVLTSSRDLLQFLYYSISTIGTWGYGNIQPTYWTTQLVSSLEVVFGVGVFVFFLFALSQTFSSAED